MNIKDRRILLFLQIFYLLVGLYHIARMAGGLYSGQSAETLFEFQNNTLPVVAITASLVVGIASLVSGFAIWVRASWMHGFALFTSGILLSYHLLGLSEAIYNNSFEIIPYVLVIIVVLQSFPYLLRRSYRSM